MTTRQAQLERLFKEHQEALLRFVRGRAPHMADDVVADTFVVAVRRTDAIPADAELAWLLGVAKNVIRDHQRAERRAARFVSEVASGAPHSTPGPEPRTIGPALNELPPTERAALALTSLAGLSAGEAAEQLGMSPGSVRNAMMRGRRALAVQLGGAALLLIVGITALVMRAGNDAHDGVQRLARSLARDSQLAAQVEASGAGRGGLYTLAADLRLGTQEFGLGDGIVQRGPIGGPLTVTAPQQLSRTQRDRAVAASAPVIRALRTVTEGQVQRVLDQASRGELPIARRDAVDVITARVNSYDGPVVTLRITVDHASGRLRRVAVRSEGRWTTLTFRNLRFSRPAEATRPSTPTPERAARPAVERRAASRKFVARLDPRTGIPWPEGMGRDEAAKNTARVKELPPYAGDTHSVVATRTEERDRAGGPAIRRAQTWWERGGGQRMHTITWRITPSGEQLPESERWASPVMVATRTWDERGTPQPLTVQISCAARQEGFVWLPRRTVVFTPRNASTSWKRGQADGKIRGRRVKRLELGFYQYTPDGTITAVREDPRDPKHSLTGWTASFRILARTVERWQPSRRERAAGATGFRQLDYLQVSGARRNAAVLDPVLPERFLVTTEHCEGEEILAADATTRGVPPHAPDGYLPMVARF